MGEENAAGFRTGLAGSYDSFFRAGGFGFDDRKQQGFANLGYFEANTPTLAAASENMMAQLLGLLRRPGEGLVLDVGCGLGGTSRYLARHYEPRNVHGINISAYQLKQCRTRVPEAHFHLMPAEALTFPDGMFDVVVSVEAACHFQGRREFLSEALRVLKPGGEIVVADILFNAQPQSFAKMLSGQEVYQDLDAYRALWEGCDFAEVTLQDVTRECWVGFSEHIRRQLVLGVRDGGLDAGTFQRLLKFGRNIERLPVSAYVFAHAVKPA